MAHRNGIMVLDTGASQPRTVIETEAESVLELVESRFHSDRIYGLGDQNLYVLELDHGHWAIAFSVPLDGASAATMIETAPDQLWFGNSRGGPQRWTLDMGRRTTARREVFGKAQGLELDPASGSSLFQLDGQIHVISGEQGFRLDQDKFIPDVGPPFTLVDRPNELVVEQTPLGNYAFTRRQMWFRPIKGTAWKPLHLGSQLAAGYGRLRYNADGVLRVATWSGLLQFNPGEQATGAGAAGARLRVGHRRKRRRPDPAAPAVVERWQAERNSLRLPAAFPLRHGQHG
jgi:hypothetical protein